MGTHAVVSASSSHRWLYCTPSARLEQAFEDTSGEAAKEGTAAHELAEHKIRSALKIPSERPTSVYDSEELEQFTDGYVQYVLDVIAEVQEACRDPMILIEQRLNFSHYVPEGFGTGDCVIIADGTLHVIDFKYGQNVIVEAEENPQMKLYALGALAIADHLYDVANVMMTIYQPRRHHISTFHCSTEALYQWADEELKPKAALAFQGKGPFCSGEWCQFCRAQVRCRAKAEEKLALASYEFVNPNLLTDEEIADVLKRIEDLASWGQKVKTYAINASINQGKQWPGFKLVAGKSQRKYRDEQAVARALHEAGHEDVYKQSLLPLTKLEKKLGRTAFQDLVGPHLTRSTTKPTLVPVSDERPESLIGTAKSDFMEE
ncbi:DUF2800 domain-containing protein [Salisediminibacterium selenitireducens]|uniref:DUF2800 domain-containing protein n=1 Tax=Bacillus selenitireducens (strain ATCC 700615 / DSM 15326 / MLS10) TaxID=439292 RepID=D6XYZ0_BACIE|nr:DUF2800 domain-containing protein [Salisediminibacterium selenitireducens]ADH98298.1 conserved hypothetical protein [[Bacillus] selenitireducens MLS10]